jgi:hypothetical protein
MLLKSDSVQFSHFLMKPQTVSVFRSAYRLNQNWNCCEWFQCIQSTSELGSEGQFLSNSSGDQYLETKMNWNMYLVFAQFNSAGWSSAPVQSWWKLHSILILKVRGGLSDCPQGVILSRMGSLRLFVSLALAKKTLFCIF